jgi:hypothetical protein
LTAAATGRTERRATSARTTGTPQISRRLRTRPLAPSAATARRRAAACST